MNADEYTIESIHDVVKQKPEDCLRGHGTIAVYENGGGHLSIRQEAWPENDVIIEVPYERIPALIAILQRKYDSGPWEPNKPNG